MIAKTVKSSLAGAGITVEIVEDEDPIHLAENPKNKIDMVPVYAQPFFPDSPTLIEQILDFIPQRWVSDEQRSRLQESQAMSGDARDQAGASFAHDLVADGLLIPYGYPVDGVYFGDSVGCRTITSGIFNIDLVALCAHVP